MTVTVTRPTATESTLTFTVTALRDIVEGTVLAAIRYIYPIRYQAYDAAGEPIPFDSLTNAQKLKVLDRELIYYIRELASSGHINDLVAATRTAAEIEVVTKFELDSVATALPIKL